MKKEETMERSMTGTGLDLTLSVMDETGHSELSFTEEYVRLRWKKTTRKERGMVKKVLRLSKDLGLVPHGVDGDGKPDKPLKKIPTLSGRKETEILLVPSADRPAAKGNIAVLAECLIDQETKKGMIVMEAQKDGTWKKLREGEFKAKKEKQAVTASKPVGGG